MTGVALSLLWSIARGALEVSGSATCPSPAEVEAEIARRGGIPVASDQRAELDQEAEETDSPRLRLRLFDTAGKLLGERTLLADSHCQALAVTVATMLLSFELDLGEAPPAGLLPEQVESVPMPGPVRLSLAIEAGIGGFLSLASDGAGAGAGLALASIGISGSPFQPEIGAEIESARSLRIGGGFASWERLWVAPGLQYRFLRRPRVWASAHLDVPIGAALAAGSGLGVNHSGAVFDLGIGLGIRVGLGPASLSRVAGGSSGLLPWLGLWAIGWPVQRDVFLSGGSSAVRLPPFELLLGLGLSWSKT